MELKARLYNEMRRSVRRGALKQVVHAGGEQQVHANQHEAVSVEL